MTFIGIFYIQGKQKLSLRGRETIQESFAYGETQSLKDFIRSIFLTTFWWKDWCLSLEFSLYPRIWLGARDSNLYLFGCFSFL